MPSFDLCGHCMTVVPRHTCRQRTSKILKRLVYKVTQPSKERLFGDQTSDITMKWFVCLFALFKTVLSHTLSCQNTLQNVLQLGGGGTHL